jgi:hypothetical protein
VKSVLRVVVTSAVLLLATGDAPGDDDRGQEAGVLVFRGIVRDGTGAPLAGAVAEVRRAGRPSDALGEGAVCDARGIVELRVPARLIGDGPDAFAPIVVRITADGFATRNLTVPFATTDVEVRLPPARATTIVVTNDAGEVVPGIEVSMAGPFAANDPARARYLGYARTDNRGRAFFADTGAEALSVGIYDRDHWRVERAVPGGMETPIVLERLTRVAGRVVRSGDREPIAGARVYAKPEPAISAADGTFELRVLWEQRSIGQAGIALAERRLTVLAAGYRMERVPVDSQEIGDIALQPAEPVVGRIVDRRGSPVPGASVEMLSLVSGVPRRPLAHPLISRADAAGLFSFPSPPAADPVVVVTDPNHETAVLAVDEQWTGNVALSPGAMIRGQVRRDGSPVPGARVSAVRPRGHVAPIEAVVWEAGLPLTGDLECRHVYSDAGGHFELRGVPAGATGVVATWGDCLRSVEVPIRPGGEIDIGTLIVERTLPITGTIRGAQGEPVPGVEVHCTALSVDARAVTTVSDARGRFDSGPLPLGPYRVVAEPRRCARISRDSWPGDRLELVALSLEGSAQLRIQCRGTVAEEGLITIRRTCEPHVSAEESIRIPDGGALFERLVPGKYHARIVVPGYVIEDREIDVVGDLTETAVRLTLGSATGITADPRASIEIQTLRGRAAKAGMVADERGDSEVTGLGPGLYRFIARAAGCLTVIREVDVAADGLAGPLDLRGGASARLRVRVRTASGAPVVGASVALETEDGYEFTEGLSTNERGDVEIAELARGALVVRATDGGTRARTEVTIQPGMDLVVEIVLGDE